MTLHYWTRFSIGLAIFGIYGTSALAQSCEPEFLSAFGGQSQDIAVLGSDAYVAREEAGLYIFDISDVTSPELVGVLGNIGFRRSVAVTEGIACAVGYNYRQSVGTAVFIDIEDPANPFTLAVVEFPDAPFRVYVEETLAYVAHEASGFSIIDFSNPTSPQVLGTAGADTNVLEVFPRDNLVFVAAGENGFRVYDASDPSNMDLLGSVETPFARAVKVVNDYAYVADGDLDDLLVIDVSNPRMPHIVGTEAVPSAYDLDVQGDFVYVAAQINGTRVVDVSVPTDPTLLTPWDPLGDIRGLCAVGVHVYSADHGDGLRIYDASDPTQLTTASTTDTLNSASEPKLLSEDLICVTDFVGIQIVDVSIPSLPVTVAEMSLGQALHVVICDGFGYVSRGYIPCPSCLGGFSVVDLRNPSGPDLVAEVTSDEYLSDGIACANGMMYLAKGPDGIGLYDVTTPSRPEEVGSIKTNGHARSLAVTGNLLFATISDIGVEIYDLKPEPELISSVDMPGPGSDITVHNDTLYIANGDQGLCIIDVSDPSEPTVLSSKATPDFASGVDVFDGYVVVTGSEPSLHVIQVSDPSNPVHLGTTYFTGSAFKVTSDGHFAYVGSGSAGLTSIDISSCLLQAGDLDSDGDVDFADLLLLLDAWGTCAPGPGSDCHADLDDSGAVGFGDLLILLDNWS